MRVLAGFLTVFGIACLLLSVYLIYERTNPNNLAFSDFVQEGNEGQNFGKTQPLAITLPTLKKTLPIFPAIVSKDSWQTSPSGVSYLSSSPLPGEKGNSILYGHNWPNLLGSLAKMKPGDRIEIAFSDGSIREFVVAYTTTVNPGQVEILKDSEDSRLTLYTCTGFLDSKRFVVTAKLKIPLNSKSETIPKFKY